jgi:hypothetical protein
VPTVKNGGPLGTRRKARYNGGVRGAGKRINIKIPMLKFGKYRHYKRGTEYELVGIAKHSETLEEMVVYRALYGEHELWVRPLKMFVEDVEIDGKKVPRYEFIGE